MQSQVQASFDSYPSHSLHVSRAGPNLGDGVGEAELLKQFHDSRTPGPRSSIRSEAPELQKMPLRSILIRNALWSSKSSRMTMFLLYFFQERQEGLQES